MATIIRKAVELKSPRATCVPGEETKQGAAAGTVTGKSISSRGFNLKQRLVNFARSDNSNTNP